jgi:hypothetical protein
MTRSRNSAQEIAMSDRLVPADPPARGQVISGLRQLADYLDHHPAVPVHESGWDLLVFACPDTEETGRAEVDQIASVLGVQAALDAAGGSHYTATKAFGRITYHFVHISALQPRSGRTLWPGARRLGPIRSGPGAGSC